MRVLLIICGLFAFAGQADAMKMKDYWALPHLGKHGYVSGVFDVVMFVSKDKTCMEETKEFTRNQIMGIAMTGFETLTPQNIRGGNGDITKAMIGAINMTCALVEEAKKTPPNE